MSEMTPRERILAAMRHQPVDRLPTDIWATPEIWARLEAHFHTTDRIAILEALGIDGLVGISPEYIGPALRQEDGIHYDEWGMGYRNQEYGSGGYDEQVVYPLAGAETIDDLDAFPWPSADWYDYSCLAQKAAAHPERAIEIGYTAPFYFHNKLRGLEQSLMDPLERPEFTHCLLQHISDSFTDYHRRCFEATRGLAHVTQVTDDFGAQHGLMISPRTFESFYRGPMQRAIDLAHEFDLIVFHHDDGDNRKLLPRLVEMGIQVLNPIQWRCGDWDLAALKAQLGDRLCFHGGVDNQQTLPFGTVEDVRAEVRRLKQALFSDGTGYILAPCHNLQPVTPIENILAMYDEAKIA
ncbi:MAG TPA: uroporphyrinogen decarboxylase family protein [Anaerolineaceae bacterium]